MDLYKEVIKHISFNDVHKSKYKFYVAGSIYRGSTDPSDIDIIMNGLNIVFEKLKS